MKYKIQTNYDDNSFGYYVPGIECRRVGIDEMKGYYFWPGDVIHIFMDFAHHCCPTHMFFEENGYGGNITANIVAGRYYIEFVAISEERAEELGLKEYRDNEFFDMLREDYKKTHEYVYDKIPDFKHSMKECYNGLINIGQGGIAPTLISETIWNVCDQTGIDCIIDSLNRYKKQGHI